MSDIKINLPLIFSLILFVGGAHAQSAHAQSARATPTKAGDEVEHKSGGPKMVVKGYEPKDGEEVVCEWFNGNTPHEKAFHQDVLIPYVYRSPVSWINI